MIPTEPAPRPLLTTPAPAPLPLDGDDLDWNIDRDGRMADHATHSVDAEPTTISWEG